MKSTHIIQELSDIAFQMQLSFLIELASELGRFDMTISQYALLCFIHHNPGLNMTKLAELTGHRSLGITVPVERLIATGYAERHIHPNDRRQILIYVTKKGTALAESLEKNIGADIKKIFQDLTQTDIEAWVRIYRVILVHSGRSQEEKLRPVLGERPRSSPVLAATNPQGDKIQA
jgi:DNA-binding MarR family transcriptional regulator